MFGYFIFDPFKFSYESFNFCMNEFKKAPYFSQVLSAPAGAIF